VVALAVLIAKAMVTLPASTRMSSDPREPTGISNGRLTEIGLAFEPVNCPLLSIRSMLPQLPASTSVEGTSEVVSWVPLNNA
jgi:hypothetical protein